ncbi:FtsX-like permease family protein [Cellulomonas sp.]|uniref:FtsX-like permease family protein n=1 Tax=Cellulomonas sp. TaxID=40001 RepID=UPI00258BDCAB|nr:FtsX-like permease family protein [Cellulomonas sp.]MCR6690612.1 ABC transporter permease [Cellulomonas sp.]
MLERGRSPDDDARAASPTSRRSLLPGRPRAGALLRDGFLTARAQPVATATAALVVALVTLVTLLTTGRAAATEAAVVESIDAIGTRLVVVTDASGDAGIDPGTVAAVAAMDSVTWAFGLGPAQDVTNAQVGGASPVPMRAVVGDLPTDARITWGRAAGTSDEILIGEHAAPRLRLLDGVGPVTDGARRYAAVGQVTGAGPLSFLSDGAWRPARPDEVADLRFVYVLADSAGAAQEVARSVEALVVAREPRGVDVSVSDGVLRLRDVVAGRLGAASRQTMAAVLGVGLVLVTVTMLGAVAGRRRDFGRRRALGATQSAVVVLVLVQSACAGLAGTAVGACAGLAGLRATGVDWPAPQFVGGVMVLAVLVTLAGSIPPALAAARRDPVRILRVP